MKYKSIRRNKSLYRRKSTRKNKSVSKRKSTRRNKSVSKRKYTRRNKSVSRRKFTRKNKPVSRRKSTKRKNNDGMDKDKVTNYLKEHFEIIQNIFENYKTKKKIINDEEYFKQMRLMQKNIDILLKEIGDECTSVELNEHIEKTKNFYFVQFINIKNWLSENEESLKKTPRSVQYLDNFNNYITVGCKVVVVGGDKKGNVVKKKLQQLKDNKYIYIYTVNWSDKTISDVSSADIEKIEDEDFLKDKIYDDYKLRNLIDNFSLEELDKNKELDKNEELCKKIKETGAKLNELNNKTKTLYDNIFKIIKKIFIKLTKSIESLPTRTPSTSKEILINETVSSISDISENEEFDEDINFSKIFDDVNLSNFVELLNEEFDPPRTFELSKPRKCVKRKRE